MCIVNRMLSYQDRMNQQFQSHLVIRIIFNCSVVIDVPTIIFIMRFKVCNPHYCNQ